jgi:hypothetical protein
MWKLVNGTLTKVPECKHPKIVNISFSEAKPLLACSLCGKLQQEIEDEEFEDFEEELI